MSIGKSFTTKPEKQMSQKSNETRIPKHLAETQQRLVKKYGVKPIVTKRLMASKSVHQLNVPSNEELSFTKQISAENQ